MTVDRSRPSPVMVLAVDPGTTTGLALLALDPADGGRPHAVWSDQLQWREAANAVDRRLGQLKEGLESGKLGAAHVVAEKFTVNPQTASRGQQGIEDAIGLRGVVRWLCGVRGLDYVGTQDASSAKSLVKDETLKGLRLYTPGMKHSNDAYRHAVLFGVRAKLIDTRHLLERR